MPHNATGGGGEGGEDPRAHPGVGWGDRDVRWVAGKGGLRHQPRLGRVTQNAGSHPYGCGALTPLRSM